MEKKMSITDQLKKAEKGGKSLSKDKLIALLKASAHKHYPIAKDGRGEYIIVSL